MDDRMSKDLDAHIEAVMDYLTSTLKQARGNKARILLLASLHWLHELKQLEVDRG